MATGFPLKEIDTDGEARFVVSAAGIVEEANDAALQLLGVTLDELRAAPSGTFALPRDDEEQRALREAWVEVGATAAVGHMAIRRADGGVLRVRYVLGLREDGRFLVGLRALDVDTDRPSTVFASAGHALAAWRAAERRLETVPPGTAEWDLVQAEIASFRDEYRRLFEARRGSDRADVASG